MLRKITRKYLVKISNILRLQDKIEIRHRCSLFRATIRHAVRSPFINTVGLTMFREGVKCLCTLVNLGPAGSSPYAIFFRSPKNSPSTSKKYNYLRFIYIKFITEFIFHIDLTYTINRLFLFCELNFIESIILNDLAILISCHMRFLLLEKC